MDITLTDHPVAAALCDAWGGPLVSTSANIHGRSPATSALRVHMTFNGQLDYIVHGNDNATHKPSEIRDGLTGKVLRH